MFRHGQEVYKYAQLALSALRCVKDMQLNSRQEKDKINKRPDCIGSCRFPPHIQATLYTPLTLQRVAKYLDTVRTTLMVKMPRSTYVYIYMRIRLRTHSYLCISLSCVNILNLDYYKCCANTLDDSLRIWVSIRYNYKHSLATPAATHTYTRMCHSFRRRSVEKMESKYLLVSAIS